MGKIHRLDEHLMNMISAGEVVERPSGIVKELIENSIDAEANEIEVTIKEGGITYLEVKDNGTGMDAQDATMAFERHATSKIQTQNDLFSIHTMGFRGEALPSIASVSEVKLYTNNREESTMVRISYGQLMEVKSMYCEEGTDIIVENLFQKTPARLKYLKSKQYETAVVNSIVEKYALGHPEIAFSLISEGKQLLSFNGNNNLEEVMVNVYGRETLRNIIYFENEDYDFKICGAYVLPNITRASNNYITQFINGRLIRHYRLNKVIMEAFSDYLFNDRYPIVVLNVECDAQLVDVNVHPTKKEIRLSKEQQLEDLVRRTLLDSLHKKMSAPEAKMERPKERVQFTTLSLDEPLTKQPEVLADSVTQQRENPVVEQQGYISENSQPIQNNVLMEEPEVITEIIVKDEQTERKAVFPDIQVIGQLHGNYILGETEEGLYIIDQHAAQERYNYELFQKKMLEQNNDQQPLLIPYVKEVGTIIMNDFDSFAKMCLNLKLEIEPFGTDTIVIRQIPLWMQNIDMEIYLNDLIDIYKNDSSADLLTIRDHALESMACHASVKFNTHLGETEMKEIIDHLKSCVNPFKCPHGRPTFILITEKQLIKEFLR